MLYLLSPSLPPLSGRPIGEIFFCWNIFFFLVEVLVHGSVAGILWCPGAFSGADFFFFFFFFSPLFFSVLAVAV